MLSMIYLPAPLSALVHVPAERSLSSAYNLPVADVTTRHADQRKEHEHIAIHRRTAFFLLRPAERFVRR